MHQLKFFSICLLCFTAFGLYEEQIGLHDWTIQNAGEFDQGFIASNQFVFQLKEQPDLFGILQMKNGELQMQQNENEKLLTRLNSEKKDIYTYSKKQSIINKFNLKKNKFVANYPIRTENQIIASETISIGNILVLTEKDVIVIADKLSKKEQTSLINAQENEKFVAIHNLNDEKYWLISHQEDKNEICISSFVATNYEQIYSSHQVLKCFALTNKFSIEKLFFQNSFILYDNDNEFNVYFIDESQSQTGYRTYKKQAEKYQFIKNSEFVVFETETHYNIFEISISESNLKPLYILEKSQNYHAFDVDFQKPPVIIITSIQNSKFTMNLLDTNTKNLLKLFESQIPFQTDQIKNMWIKSIKENSKEFKFLIQTQDLTTFVYDFRDNLILWVKEYSLSAIQSTHFVNYDEITSKRVNQYYESLDKYGLFNQERLLINFLLRCQSEFENIVNRLKSFFYNLIHTLTKISQTVANYKELAKTLNSLADNTNYEIFYALKQMILVHTKYNTIFAIDSKDGSTIWKINLNFIIESQYQLKGMFTLEEITLENDCEEIQKNIIFLFHSEQTKQVKFGLLSPLTGIIDFIQEGSLKIDKIKKIIKFSVNKDLQNEGLLIIDSQEKLHFYPPKLQLYFQEQKQNMVFYSIDEEENQIYGIKFIKDQPEKIWNVQLGNNEKILSAQSAGSNNPNFYSSIINGIRTTLPDSKKILFKLINFNTLAVMTKQEESNSNQLNLYLINAYTGRIIFNNYNLAVNFNFPVNLINDDNSVYVTYFNSLTLNYEIWVVEQFQQKVENSLFEMFEKYYFSKTNVSDINYNAREMETMILEQKYGLSLGIKYCTSFYSRYGITRKNLIIVTTNNQLYSLDRNLISARRAVIDPLQQIKNLDDKSFQSHDLPPYNYVLPTNYLHFISYYKSLSYISKIDLSPTHLESTSLVLAYGRDIYFTKFSPENTYDRLNEDFNYAFLILSVAGVFFLTIFMKYVVNSTYVKKYFYNK